MYIHTYKVARCCEQLARTVPDNYDVEKHGDLYVNNNNNSKGTELQYCRLQRIRCAIQLIRSVVRSPYYELHAVRSTTPCAYTNMDADISHFCRQEQKFGAQRFLPRGASGALQLRF